MKAALKSIPDKTVLGMYMVSPVDFKALPPEAKQCLAGVREVESACACLIQALRVLGWAYLAYLDGQA